MNLVTSEATHADGAAAVGILQSEYFLDAFEVKTSLSRPNVSVAHR